MTSSNLLPIISAYKSRIAQSHLQDEVYKWELVAKFKGRPDTNAPDFEKEYKSVKFGNLIYAMAIATGNFLVTEHSEELRSLFKHLFDETLPLNERVEYFNTETLRIYKLIEGKHSHHQDERSISAYLTFHNPEKYTFYKNGFYVEFCKLMGVAPAGKNKKYSHYLELLNEFIQKYIVPDKELIEQVRSYIPAYYDGTNHLLLAQDILYSMLDRKTTDEESNEIEENEFEKFIKQFNPKDFDQFINFAREIVNVHQLQNGDERLTYNYYDDRLVISVGQRYCLGLFSKDKKRKFTVLSRESFTDNGEEFDGENNKAFLNYLQEWNVTEEQKINIHEGIGIELNRTNRSGYRKHNKVDFEKYVFEHIHKKGMSNSLNQILYGPPGTGKTYNSINKSLEILGIDTQGLSRNTIKNYFDEAVEKGQIVFTTFHQSMSYEDFIEGIKPKTIGTNVVYEIKNGIFKKISDLAKDNYELSKNPQSNFSDAFEMLKNELAESENNELRIETIKTHFFITNITDRNIEFRKASGATNHDLVITTLKELFSDKREMKSGLAVYYYPLVEKLKEYKLDRTATTIQNYVLIIDEINRGNVSQIFGELITLIEDGKRLGQDETITLKLPYSQEDFVVPPNLFIIGTMNTADRSVEALDTALRRRFSFTEMLPQPALLKDKGEKGSGKVGEIDLDALLTTINERIEALVDRDHTVGHAFFMEINSLDSLRNVFANKVIPLLQEYFYGDYAKMEMVIGPDFFNIKDTSKIKFAVKPEDFESTGKTYQIKNLSDKIAMPDEMLLKAFDKLIKGVA